MMESVVPDDYEALCVNWGGERGSGVAWRELLHALGGRVGWWFVDPRIYPDYDGGPMWCFGATGDSEFSVVAVGTRFAVYVADTDEEVVLDEIGHVVAWLDEYEQAYGGISPALSQLLDYQRGGGASRPPAG